MFNSPSHLPAPYDRLHAQLRAVLPPERLITDRLRTLAYGTDASCYRLVPKIVAVVESEEEVQRLMACAREVDAPVTFRAAGTSLSGQAITDSVLVLLGENWDGCVVEEEGEVLKVQPGVIGAEANRVLATYGRKIGPDPASINAAKIGGIAANNASGMCCGTAQNSYNTLRSMRVMLADGAMLDTGSETSRTMFGENHKKLLDDLSALAERVRKNKKMANRIKTKFKIKNTTGYALNALIDFKDPIDILQHLMIGSEGTLGFISEMTYKTVPEYANKASALILFPNMQTACNAVVALKMTPVSAVEVMDRAALRSVEGKPGMPDYITGLGDEVTALLVEVRGKTKRTLTTNRKKAEAALEGVETVRPIEFTADPVRCQRYWNIRKGLFPAVGAVREIGTTVIIEDVAFPIDKLAPATLELQRLCKDHGYDEAIIFGHALEGNLHFVFTQNFNSQEEIERYGRFMDAITEMVVKGYDGSLKAEHGTGRNMAPFVEMEWGAEAYQLMWEIKRLLDPQGLLNPGVLLNADETVHLQNLKPFPAAHEIVDKCIECGFCEPKCPSKGLTLSPRQRIVAWREISRREAAGEGDPDGMKKAYAYQGVDTCAACGLCATACPVGIETGLLTKQLRMRSRTPFEHKLGDWIADHYGTAMAATSLGLKAADFAHGILGSRMMASLSEGARKVSGGRSPRWMAAMPRGQWTTPVSPEGTDREKVVYFPSCAARTMGPARGDEVEPLPKVTARVLRKAGFEVIYLDDMNDLCCGQPFDSKGLPEAGDRKAGELEAALMAASENGRHPIVFDTSPCSYRMMSFLNDRLRIFDVTEFIHDVVLERLEFQKQAGPVAVHATCSTRKMMLEDKLKAIAEACAEEVIVPPSVECCGWAGDKGFTTPELNRHALAKLKRGLENRMVAGYSTSRTCEIGLSEESGIVYRSIVHLIDEAING